MLIHNSEWFFLLVVGTGIFFLGGVVKGTIGIGLPLVAVPALSLMIPTHQAMALLAIPVLSSNFWQAYQAKGARHNLQRYWPLISCLIIATIITVWLTISIDVTYLKKLLALSLLIAICQMIFKPSLALTHSREKILAPAIGLLAGVVGGVSSLTGPVIITYLLSLKLSRENFVSSVSLIYFLAALPFYGTMGYFGKIGVHELTLSLLALIPVALGMKIGRSLREKIGESLFRKILLILLSMLTLLLLLT
tara:strand:- start:376 stop:1125 length:750 start_codon:yes stop_codon:yes gene_type:complete